MPESTPTPNAQVSIRILVIEIDQMKAKLNQVETNLTSVRKNLDSLTAEKQSVRKIIKDIENDIKFLHRRHSNG